MKIPLNCKYLKEKDYTSVLPGSHCDPRLLIAGRASNTRSSHIKKEETSNVEKFRKKCWTCIKVFPVNSKSWRHNWWRAKDLLQIYFTLKRRRVQGNLDSADFFKRHSNVLQRSARINCGYIGFSYRLESSSSDFQRLHCNTFIIQEKLGFLLVIHIPRHYTTLFKLLKPSF